MKENFDFSRVPNSFLLCFNQSCPRSGECLHFLAGQHVPADRPCGPAVYPSACQDGTCRYFRHSNVVRLAWGFDGTYTPLEPYFRSKARSDVQNMLGSVGTYYRYDHGERKLSPEQQERIHKILQDYGYNGPVTFKHVEECYDFTR